MSDRAWRDAFPHGGYEREAQWGTAPQDRRLKEQKLKALEAFERQQRGAVDQALEDARAALERFVWPIKQGGQHE